MSSSFQQQGGRATQPSQLTGGVQMFDPTQFQHQPSSAPHGDVTQQQQHYNPVTDPQGVFFSRDQQQGQESSWDHWGRWNWNMDGQNSLLSGYGEGHATPLGMGENVNKHVEGQPDSQHQQQQFVSQEHGQYFTSQDQNAIQFHNPQGYHKGSNADANQPLHDTAGKQQASVSYPGFCWDQTQQQWVPVNNPDMDQRQEQNLEMQGQHFYHQPHQTYFDPSTWNSSDPTQSYQWDTGDDIRRQFGADQGVGRVSTEAGGQELRSDGGIYTGIPVSSPESQHAGEDRFSSGMMTSQPSVDLHQVRLLSQEQGHKMESSVDSSTTGTVPGFFGHEENCDEAPYQPHPAMIGSPEAMQTLKVSPFQRTDSGISNASLQTVNISADEDSKDGTGEVTHGIGSLQLDSDLLNRGSVLPSYAHPGDFSGFGNYSSNRQEAKPGSSGSRESDEQNPMLNDWEIVPPQSQPSASHSQNDPTDNIIYSDKALESGKSGEQAPDSSSKGPKAEVSPAGSQSASTQHSESFTAISSTSGSGDAQSSVPFSQSSSYHPSASSTPFTSPGAQSVLSHPSSIPSSPPKTLAAGSIPSPVVSSPHASPPVPAKGGRGNQDGAGNVQGSAEKVVLSQNVDCDKNLDISTATDSCKPSAASSGTGSESRSGKPLPSPGPQGMEGKESGGMFSSPARRHHSAFHPVHSSQRAKHNMSPATTLWDNLDTTPTANILLAPAAPLIIPSLGGTTTAVTAATSASTASVQSSLQKCPLSSGSLEKLSGRKERDRSARLNKDLGHERDGGRDRDGERSGRRVGEKNGTNKSSHNKNEESSIISKSREEDNRSLGSLDELDATPDFTDDSVSRGSRGYGRDPRDPRDSRDSRYDPHYDPHYDRPSSRSDGYRDDYRRPRESHRGYNYRDPYYDERYDRPRSRQDEERTSRPSSRSAREYDRPRSTAEMDRDRDGYKDPYRGGYAGYQGYNQSEYYYDDRERFYRYYRDSRYRHGYAEEMGQYSHQYQHHPYDNRYADYYGYPLPLPPLSHHPNEDHDRSSLASLSRGQTPTFDDMDPSNQDYYGRSSRPASRADRERERDPYRHSSHGYGGYAGGYSGYGGGYYDAYYQQQYPYYNYPQYGGQQSQEGSAYSGRMTPPKYLLPHVRVCFGPIGQLVTVLPTRPSEGQPATVEIHDVQTLLQDHPEMEDLKAFPGPLIRNETHKNDVLLYCQKKAKECSEDVDMLDRESAELIWRLLELLLKQNGTVIGTDIADLLLTGHEPTTHEFSMSGLHITQSVGHSSDPLDTPDKEDSRGSSPAVRTSTDRTVVTATQLLEESTDRFRHLLLYGRKKEALDWAMKRNLWGHALFLASKMDNRTHASVMTRFANTAMRMNDPLQTLYQLMSGRQPASVSNFVDERWGDWRPHLAMILSNHSSRPELDMKSIIALGDTLATKHCLHASHFCYLMAQVDFGSFFRKSSKIVLIGSNHHNLPLDDFANNGAVQCTEVYEYAQSLGSKFYLPQFQVYKFLYACRLAEYGMAQEAFHYLEVISTQVLMNPGRYHPAFTSILYCLASKLKQGDPQKLHAGHDSADPEWLTQLHLVCQGYEEGSIQFKSGSGTPLTGGVTPSSESGEVAGYAVDNTGGTFAHNSAPAVVGATYQSAPQTQYGGDSAVQGEASAQQIAAGAEQYSQYTQPMTGDQYNWQQHKGYVQQPDPYAQQQYDPSLYQQQWQGYNYSQPYGSQQTATQEAAAGYPGENIQAATDQGPRHQQEQQASSHNHHSATPHDHHQHRSSLTSHSSATDPAEGDDDDDDDDDDDEDDNVDGSNAAASNFDYFGAASQQKIIPPSNRYRTTSTSSAGSTGRRRKRTTSGSSTGSVRAAKPSAPANSNKKNTEKGAGGMSWLGGFFGKFRGKNEMILPDDKNPAIVWDDVNKRWINKDGSDNSNIPAAPPPKDNDLMGNMPPPSAPSSSGEHCMNGPPTMNRFSKPKGRGARGQYVDVLNPTSSTSSTVPSNLFSVMPGADSNTSAAPKLFNPSGVATSGSSTDQLATPFNQSAHTLAAPSQDLSRSSSLSSLSREIQQLTTKAQEFGESQSTDSVKSQQTQGLPMMFNPSHMSQPASQASNSSGSGLKYGHRRVYPK